MTEQEWLTCDDPAPMLEFLQGKASDRKLRLLAVACCNRASDLFKGDRSVAADIASLEFRADGNLEEAQASTWPFGTHYIMRNVLKHNDAWVCAWNTVSVITSRSPHRNICSASELFKSLPYIPRALFEIFDNPFRPIVAEADWLSWSNGTVPRIAQRVYDERSFGNLPILADALEEAGCDNAEILNHCRQPGEHVRGCWVVDLMLGKQ